MVDQDERPSPSIEQRSSDIGNSSGSSGSVSHMQLHQVPGKGPADWSSSDESSDASENDVPSHAVNHASSHSLEPTSSSLCAVHASVDEESDADMRPVQDFNAEALWTSSHKSGDLSLTSNCSTPNAEVMEAAIVAKENEWHETEDQQWREKLLKQLQKMEIRYCWVTGLYEGAPKKYIRDEMRKRFRRRYTTNEKYDDLPGQHGVYNPHKRKRPSQRVRKLKYDYACGQVMSFNQFKRHYSNLPMSRIFKKWNLMLSVKAAPRARLYHGLEMTLDDCLTQWHTRWSCGEIE